MRTYVGADWSASCVECAAAGEEGEPVSIGRAEPTLPSVQALLERARRRCKGGEIHVVIEAGAVGWIRLFHAGGAAVHVVDPKQAKRFAESLCSSGAKSDRGDAAMLVELGRSPVHLPAAWAPGSDLHMQLDVLATAHEQLTQDLIRETQRLRALLRQNMPMVDAEIHDVGTSWASQLLAAVPTPWHAQNLTRDEYDGILKGKRLSAKSRDALWQALTQTKALGLTEAVASTMARTVQRLLDLIATLRSQLREVDSELDELTRDLDARKLFETVGGIGLQQATILLLDGFGEIPEHRDQAGIRMGACPVFSGSGLRKDHKPKGGARMRRSAPARARRSVYLMGRLAIRSLGWARAMFADAKRNGKSAPTAFRRIARALLRILTAMIRDNVPYDDNRYVAGLKAKGVAWAADL
jgi:transposase